MREIQTQAIRSLRISDGPRLILLGRRMVGRIQGLRTVFWKGLLINLGLFVVLALILNVALYVWGLRPLKMWAFGDGGGALDITGRVLLWIVQLALAALFAFISLHASIGMMGMWFEDMVVRVIRHYRPIEERPFRVRSWLDAMWDGLMIAAKDLILLVLVFPLGFVPVIGGILVFCGGAYLIGRSVIGPYLTVTSERRFLVRRELRQFRLACLKIGWPHGILAVIPILGWILMPVAMTDQIIGVSCHVEKEIARGHQDEPSPNNPQTGA